MARLQDAPLSGIGSSTHLLWLAVMGLKDTYFIISGDQRRNTDSYIYNIGMNAIARDLLVNIKRDNDNKDPNYYRYFES